MKKWLESRISGTKIVKISKKKKKTLDFINNICTMLIIVHVPAQSYKAKQLKEAYIMATLAEIQQKKSPKNKKICEVTPRPVATMQFFPSGICRKVKLHYS